MSNEYKDWKADQANEARYWTSKYPFLKIKNNDVYPWLELNSDDYYWLQELPNGWVNSFCKSMCDELLEVLGSYVDDFIIIQVKEKFGRLCIYYCWDCDDKYTQQQIDNINSITDKIEKILMKYEDISYHTCVKCGEQATKYSTGWVLPYCNKCTSIKGAYEDGSLLDSR